MKKNSERGLPVNAKRVIRDFKKKGSSSAVGSRLKNSNFSSASSIFGLVLLVIIMFNIPSFVAGNSSFSTYFSFERFMNMLASAPTISMAWITDVLQPISADWGVFQFFADFINSLITLLQGVSFILVGIVNLVSYLLYFLKFLFNL